MMAKKPETPEEQWQVLLNVAREAELREFSEKTDDEVAEELKASGYDLEKLDRDGEAFAAQLFGEPVPEDAGVDKVPDPGASGPNLRLVGDGGSGPSKVAANDAEPFVAQAAEPLPPPTNVVPFAKSARRVTWVVLIAAAVAAASVGAAIALRDEPKHEPPRPDQPPEAPRAPRYNLEDDLRMAKSAREDAFQACATKDWETCTTKLNQAQVLDPEGEALPAVRAARVTAEELKTTYEQAYAHDGGSKGGKRGDGGGK